jgi:hypothetical protein
MPAIRSDNKVHEASCATAESNRQAVIAAAGSSAAAVKAADVAFYRAVIASCKTNSLPFSNFTYALIDLGTGGA